MSAWSGDPLPVNRVHDATPLVCQGAVVFQAKQCRNCHSIGGSGGQRVRFSTQLPRASPFDP